jgi:hypothetical protein
MNDSAESVAQGQDFIITANTRDYESSERRRRLLFMIEDQFNS